MGKILECLKGSFDNAPGGASSKKLSNFWVLVVVMTPPTITWTIWAYHHDDWSLLLSVLVTLSATALAYAGINSNEKIKGKANQDGDAK